MWAARGTDNVVRPSEHLADGVYCSLAPRFPQVQRGAGAAVAKSVLYASSGPETKLDRSTDQGLFYIQDLAGDPMTVHAQRELYCMALTSSDRLFLQ